MCISFFPSRVIIFVHSFQLLDFLTNILIKKLGEGVSGGVLGGSPKLFLKYQKNSPHFTEQKSLLGEKARTIRNMSKKSICIYIINEWRSMKVSEWRQNRVSNLVTQDARKVVLT